MTDDDPITLDAACEIFHGKIKPSTLRAEADRGNLTIFRVGRRYFTTRALVQEMIRKCRAAVPLRGSISTANAELGQSETDRISSAQDALSRTLRELKTRSGSTLAPSTSRNAARRH